MASTEESPASSSPVDNDNIYKVLYRLTEGIPQTELIRMEQEALQCEAELLKDIEILEDAENNEQGINDILQTPLTPLDKYWTISSLLGRLRGKDLQLPSILSLHSELPATLKPQESSSSSQAQVLEELQKLEEYTKIQTTDKLLSLFKKVQQHRASFVFKKPVKPEDAPGYTDRILFPMDLSMIRKMILTQKVIQTYQDFHKYVHLIAHNCVSFNGRETDYGNIAREFEGMVEEAIRHACTNVSNSTNTATEAPKVKQESETPATEATKSNS